MTMPLPVRVVGCGSPNGDDAVGWKVIEQLRDNSRLPSHVELRTVDGGNQLLGQLDGRGTLILIDAMSSGAEPGLIRWFDWPDKRLESLRLGSTHQLRPSEALELAQAVGVLPRRVLIAGVEAAAVSPETQVSARVAKAVPELVARIIRRIANETN